MQTEEMYFIASEDTCVGELAGQLGYHGVKEGQSLRKAKWILSISLFNLSEQERC